MTEATAEHKEAAGDASAASPEVSVVLTFRNQRGRLAARYAELSAALAGRSFELIAVDDGSIDGGAEALRAVAAQDPRLRLVRLRRPFGQTAALAAGFDRARGASIVTIDAEGQTDAADIPLLLERIAAGDDIVSGRRDVPRALPTRIGNALIGAVTGVPLHDYGCPLKAYRAEIVREMHLYGGQYRFTPALASREGARASEVTVRERPGHGVRPGAGLRRVLGVLIDLLTVRFLLGYNARPMQAIGRAGGVLLALALLTGAYLAYIKFIVGEDIGERSLTVMAVLLTVLGVQLLLFGLLAELAARLYYESQGKPIYAVREEINA